MEGATGVMLLVLYTQGRSHLGTHGIGMGSRQGLASGQRSTLGFRFLWAGAPWSLFPGSFRCWAVMVHKMPSSL